jgi:hypothetical protein
MTVTYRDEDSPQFEDICVFVVSIVLCQWTVDHLNKEKLRKEGKTVLLTVVTMS